MLLGKEYESRGEGRKRRDLDVENRRNGYIYETHDQRRRSKLEGGVEQSS